MGQDRARVGPTAASRAYVPTVVSKGVARRRPLLVNSRGYRVEEGRCRCGPGFFPVARDQDGSRAGMTHERLSREALDAVRYEHELCWEVEHPPRRRRGPPTSLGPKEVVSTQRIVGRDFSRHPVRLIAIGARMVKLVGRCEGDWRNRDIDTFVARAGALALREPKEVRRLNRFVRGAQVVVLLVSVNEDCEGSAMLQASFALWRLRVAPSACLLVLWDQGNRNSRLWPALPGLPGAQVNLVMPTQVLRSTLRGLGRVEHPARVWTEILRFEWRAAHPGARGVNGERGTRLVDQSNRWSQRRGGRSVRAAT